MQLEKRVAQEVQCADGPVRKYLALAAEVCTAGNPVVLDDDGPFSRNEKTGEVIPVHKRRGLCVFNVHALRPQQATGTNAPVLVPVEAPVQAPSSSNPSPAVFRRQANRL